MLLQVMIDHEQKQLRLIDWGLAEFYHPGKEYDPMPDFMHLHMLHSLGHCMFAKCLGIMTDACKL